MIWGEKGIGKTTLASKFPNSYVFMGEPGRRNLRIRQIPEYKKGQPVKPLTWKQIRNYRDLLIEKEKPGTIVFDTVDACWELCLNYVCQLKGIKHPSDIKDDYGKTWKEVKDEFTTVLDSFRYAGWTPIAISHARTRPITSRIGEVDYEQTIPTCPDACWKYLRAACDAVIYYGYCGNERAFHIRGNELIWSACGLEDHFLDPDGNPLREFPAGETPTDAYNTIVEAFNNERYGYASEEDEEETEDGQSETPSKSKSRK